MGNSPTVLPTTLSPTTTNTPSSTPTHSPTMTPTSQPSTAPTPVPKSPSVPSTSAPSGTACQGEDLTKLNTIAADPSKANEVMATMDGGMDGACSKRLVAHMPSGPQAVSA